MQKMSLSYTNYVKKTCTYASFAKIAQQFAQCRNQNLQKNLETDILKISCRSADPD